MDEEAILMLKAIKRQLVWDTMPHDEMLDPEFQTHFGLDPASPEVLEYEHAESHTRLDSLVPLSYTIYGCSRLISELFGRDILEVLTEPSEIELEQRLTDVIFKLNITVLAQLIGQGFAAMGDRS